MKGNKTMAFSKDAKAVFSGVTLHYGTGSADVYRKSERHAFGSSVDVVDGQGKLIDIIYAGKEITITELASANGGGGNSANLGEGSLETGIITKRRRILSNEDMEKIETEKTKFLAC